MLYLDCPSRPAPIADHLNRNEQTVRRAMSAGAAAGVFSRDKVVIPRAGAPPLSYYLYNVAPAIRSRLVALNLECERFGAGIERAERGAVDLRVHASMLLDRDDHNRKQPPTDDGTAPLTPAEIETLKNWIGLGKVQECGFSLIATLAVKQGKNAVKEREASAVGADHNQRTQQAAGEFECQVLGAVRAYAKESWPDKWLNPAQIGLMFRHWARLTGYSDLAGRDIQTLHRVEGALKIVRTRQRHAERLPELAPPPLPAFWQRPLLVEPLAVGYD